MNKSLRKQESLILQWRKRKAGVLEDALTFDHVLCAPCTSNVPNIGRITAGIPWLVCPQKDTDCLVLHWVGEKETVEKMSEGQAVPVRRHLNSIRGCSLVCGRMQGKAHGVLLGCLGWFCQTVGEINSEEASKVGKSRRKPQNRRLGMSPE